MAPFDTISPEFTLSALRSERKRITADFTQRQRLFSASPQKQILRGARLLWNVSDERVSERLVVGVSRVNDFSSRLLGRIEVTSFCFDRNEKLASRTEP